ncbi:penicillin-binding protein 1A, partial [Candidatus Poribacteria bacterium]
WLLVWLKTLAKVISLVAVVVFFIAVGIPIGMIIAYWNDLPSLGPLEYETQSWHYPTKVYSDITRFSREMSSGNLLERLERLDYEQIDNESLSEGQFYLRKPADSSTNEIKLYLRELIYPRLTLKPRLVTIDISGKKIAKIKGADGTVLSEFILEPEVVAEFYGSEGTDRELVALDEVPQDLINAFIAIEDKRFYKHPGFDLYRIFGSLYRNFRYGSRQGASTLTQQLARDLFLSRRQLWTRKIKEALLAVKIERKYTKDEVLERYLNRANLGRYGSREVYGVKEAARYYFGKDLQDLSIQECATLAAIPKDQMKYSPIKNPEDSRKRRQIVLSQMQRYGFIDKEQYDEAKASELETATTGGQVLKGHMAYFLEYIRLQVENTHDPDKIHWEGLEVYTTMDVSMQRAASNTVEARLQELDARISGYPPYEDNKASWSDGERGDGILNPIEYMQAALVSIDPSTGYVKAMVGGRDWYSTQFNRAFQSLRQPGSAFKPFVCSAGFASNLVTPATIVVDEPWEIEDPSLPDGFWRPRNFRERFYGQVTVRKLLVHSYNVATARLLYDTIKPDRAAAMGRAMGIKTPLAPYPSLALGASEVTVLELTSAYGVFANQGMRAEPICVKYVLDREGSILEENTPSVQRVLDKKVAYLTTYLMEGVVEEGTGRNSRRVYGFRRPAAGKTGTTNNETDAWFIGFTPDLVTGVWVGFDDPIKSTRRTGAEGALPIWSDFMKAAADGSVKEFRAPDGILFKDIDADTGLPATQGSEKVIREAFIRGTEPEF